jgi:membrane fusion protein, heavy metal efflux system
MFCVFRRRHALAGALLLIPLLSGCQRSASSDPAQKASAAANQSVELTGEQLRSVSVQAVGTRPFNLEREAVGNIDFDQDMTVQVFPQYQGRVLQLMANAGDRVRKDQVLLTIDSPDLVQAESTLIAADAQLKLTNAALERAKGLYAIQGMAQKDYEQAVSDQQSAEAAYKAARDAVRIFGKSDAEIDRILERRRIDASMAVPSPISGVIAARNAAPGTFIQPGGTAPYTVADVSRKWLLAEMPEGDLPSLRLGQAVDVRVMALPGRLFRGSISNIAESVDPNTRRATVRSVVSDPGDELRAQMFATFVVHVGGPVSSLAVPVDAIVREGDGTMTVWVTVDRRRFTHRTVHTGLEQNAFVQVLEGLRPGELVASTGALFISNAAVVGGAD